MPRRLRRFLRNRSLGWHLAAALTLGLVARALCSWFVYGPQALDDYKHGVYPAYQFFAGLPVDLPDYRSHLLVWLLAGFVRVGSWFGAESALAQVRAMYFGLSLVSLLGIYGSYLFARSFRSRLFGASAIYLAALFPVMPFIGTRAFGEAVAMSLVLLAFGILEPLRRARSGSIMAWGLGFALLGAATLFRFHAGLLFVSYGVIVLVQRLPGAVTGALAGGIFTLAAQYAVDFLSGKPAFGTLLSYLRENEGGAAQYGVSPWYNTWLFILALTLPPFSFVLAPHLRALWRRHWPWLVPLLVYVGAHSLVPHKEERFLYPVVGLEMWAVAWLWSAGALDRYARKVFAPALFVIGAIGLLAVCLVNTQEGEIEPPAYAESRYHSVMYLDHGSLLGISRIRFYFLRPPSDIESVSKEDLNARRIDEALEAHSDINAVVLLTSAPDALNELHALEGIQTMESRCQTLRSAGSLIDRMIYALNPKHNERRRPTWYLVCARERA
jgi:hypothetical protein